MQITDGLHHLVGHPELTLFRFDGGVLRLTVGGTLLDRRAIFRGGKERHYQASFGELVATDWQLMPGKQFDEAWLKTLEVRDQERAAASQPRPADEV